MNIPFVDLKSQYNNIKLEIDSAIQSVINETSFIKGKYVDIFEENYAKAYGVNNVVSCANGTDAIYISLKALDIGQGDEVITVANSWISTSETITQSGAKVVFVDIDPDYYTIATDKIEAKITDQTKAIIPVHLYGHPVNMDDIMRIAKKYGLYVIEDCAQAHFAKWKGQYVGTFGDAGTFSFFPGKNLGAYGDAGGIISNNDNFSRTARVFANHGALIKHQHETEGINSRLDGLQAAILSVKLKYILNWNEKRYNHARYYNKLLNTNDVVTPKIHKHANPVFHLYVIRVEERASLVEYLKDKGISTAIHYPTPLPFLEAYNYLNHKHSDFPVSASYQSQILSLPIYPEMTKNMIEYVVESLKQFY